MKKKYSSKIIATTLLIVIGVLVICVTLYTFNRHRANKAQTQEEETFINYGPPTQKEKDESSAAKQKIVEGQNNTNISTNASTKKTVTPIISRATKAEISAFIPGIFEENGICTATFTQNNTIIKKTSPGFTSANYTQCAPIAPELPNADQWSVSVSYSSTNAKGISQAKDIQ